MITIIQESRPLSAVEKYLMTQSNEIITLKNVADGTRIEVEAFLYFVDKKDEKKEVELLSILTPNKECYTCQSQTFKDAFENIYDCLDRTPFTIIKKSGTSKGGRDFITCSLDITSIE